MDVRRFVEQHDRARQLLLEGDDSAELEEHVATCASCGPMSIRLAEIDRLIADVPEPRAGLLQELLQPRRAAPAQPVCRLEMLWPGDGAGESPDRSPTLVPLVLSVEADRYQPDAQQSRRTERFIVVGRYPITIGRGPDMDVPIWDRSVSRRHAQMDWRDGGWVIRDMESTNGTRLNGARLGGSEVAYLKPGDQVRVGHSARITVRSLLPALDPAGIVREIYRLVAWAVQPAWARGGDDEQREDLRARLMDLREETVSLRNQLSSIAGRGAAAEALPLVYQRLTNILALIEHDGEGRS